MFQNCKASILNLNQSLLQSNFPNTQQSRIFYENKRKDYLKFIKKFAFFIAFLLALVLVDLSLRSFTDFSIQQSLQDSYDYVSGLFNPVRDPAARG